VRPANRTEENIKVNQQTQSSGGNTCLKACLVGCLIVVVVVVLGGIGCIVCVGKAGKGLWGAIGGVTKISAYFDAKKAQGWEVDDSQSNQPQGYGAQVQAGQLMTWRARENRDDDWTIYTWELRMANEDAAQKMNEGQTPDWREFLNWILVPRTQAAMDVHEELKLPLPDGFTLEPIDEGDQTGNGNRDKDQNPDEGNAGSDEGATSNGDGGDGASTDSGDGTDNADSGDTGHREKPRRGE